MFDVQLIDELPYRRFVGMRDDLVALPPVSKWRLAADGLSHLRAYRDRCGDAFSYLLALPLRHPGDNGEEEAACGGGRVDAFVERYEVGTVLLEFFGEVVEFSAVAREPGELGKDEPGYLPALHVGEHALRFGMLHHGLTRDTREVIKGDDLPALGFRIQASALLMDGRAFAACLVLGADAYPNPYGLLPIGVLLR